MRRKKRSLGDAMLHDATDCLHEIDRCNKEIKNTEQEYADWISRNPNGSWPGYAAKISQLEAQRGEAEGRFEALNRTRQ